MAMQLLHSKTSNGGPSEIGTVYNIIDLSTRDTIYIMLKVPNIYSPYNIYDLLEGDNLSTKDKTYIVPNVSLVLSFHCSYIVL